MLKKILFIMVVMAVVLGTPALLCCAQDDSEDANQEYVVLPNDILEISVYGESDLSVSARVSQDGTLNYPLLGNVKAVGFTVRELEKNITDLLKQDYLVNPQVRIFVKEYATISILGQVRNPGSYQMKQKLNLTQAIALAGGFTEQANASRVKIIRTANGKKQTLEVDFNQVLEKAAPDVEIKPNDTIIFEEYGRISIMGRVAKPGIYSLKKGLTVVEAIGLAGGFTSTAAPNGTRVIRMENGKKRVISVPVANIIKGGDTSRDILLEDGDTIVVPESFF